MSFSDASLAVQGLDSTPVTVEMLVIFVLILLAFVSFATERFPIDVTHPGDGFVDGAQAVDADISTRGHLVICQPGPDYCASDLILSTGSNRTGIVQLIGRKMAAFAVGYFLAFALVGAVFTVFQVTYFDAVADETVLPATDGEGMARPIDDGSSAGSHETGTERDQFEFEGQPGHGDANESR